MNAGLPALVPDDPGHSEAAAIKRDQADPLRHFRDEFCLPRAEDIASQRSNSDAPPLAAANAPQKDTPAVYLCGNSLGLMPKRTREAVNQELEDWARFGVEGHFHARHPWFPTHEFVRSGLARLVGAEEHEVVAMNSLTVNLHLMMASFYRPTKERFRIVIEDAAFPSDSYAVQSQAALHGFDISQAIVRLKPRPGEHTLRTEDVVEKIQHLGPTVALVMLGGVNYLSGQVMDMPAITKAGHAAGAIVGWDLAHAAGNIPLQLHDWNADFACWCSYKYVNSGPGAVAGCFVHERHVKNVAGFGEPGYLPRLAGWWGNDPATRFKMTSDFVPVASADAWSMSNPPVLAMAPLRASLSIFDEAGMSALRTKSVAMTNYLQALIDQLPGAERLIDVITPREPSARGCQLSLAIRFEAKALHNALLSRAVACDFREPNVIRIAPVPLYNSFHDCWRFASILRQHLAGH